MTAAAGEFAADAPDVALVVESAVSVLDVVVEEFDVVAVLVVVSVDVVVAEVIEAETLAGEFTAEL